MSAWPTLALGARPLHEVGLPPSLSSSVADIPRGLLLCFQRRRPGRGLLSQPPFLRLTGGLLRRGGSPLSGHTRRCASRAALRSAWRASRASLIAFRAACRSSMAGSTCRERNRSSMAFLAAAARRSPRPALLGGADVAPVWCIEPDLKHPVSVYPRKVIRQPVL
jgi:hypothetical protein